MAVDKYLVLDVETTELCPDDPDWSEDVGLKVACVATLEEGGEPRVWYTKDESGGVGESMLAECAHDLTSYVHASVRERGFKLFTWNGLGFDLPVLMHASFMAETWWKWLARNSIDGMFNVFWEKGYPVSLKAVAAGALVEGKTEGMDGVKAVELWADPAQRQRVLDYVGGDVEATLRVARAVEIAGGIRWQSRSGRTQWVGRKHGWLTSRQMLEAFPNKPDQGWMTDPIPPKRFTEWCGLGEVDDDDQAKLI